MLVEALTLCMTDPAFISVDVLAANAKAAELAGAIDTLHHLHRTRVWLFSGTKDTVVHQGVVTKAARLFEALGANVSTVFGVPAQHAWVTASWGAACDYKGGAYINKCAYDAPAAMLEYVYNIKLKPKASQAVRANLLTFDQTRYEPHGMISLAKTGYIYVPTACASGSKCRLMLALHGCLQTTDDIGMNFVEHSGLNEWAETNGIVVVYPQATKSHVIPYNPNGCWDWWGYASPTYAYRSGPQIVTMANIVDAITGNA
jgi:hypothetical protein